MSHGTPQAVPRAPHAVAPVRVIGATDGDPWARATWSGSSLRLLGALERQGALAGAVNVKPRALDLVEQAASWSHDGARWRQRYRGAAAPLSPLVRTAMSAIGSRRVGTGGDAVLQISGWYDANGRAPIGRLLATYQDANGALWRRRPELVLDPDDRGLARARAHEQRVYDRADVIFTMSEWARRSFVDDYGQPEGKVVTVGAGVSLDALPDLDGLARPDGPPRVLFVGRTFARKGGPTLLGAFALLREREPDAQLWIVGPPPGAPAPGVTWLGPIFRDEPGGAARLDDLFRRASVFALPSLYEGFGMPLLEAMAYALPCVGADVCAIPEIVGAGERGLLVAPGDAPALADALGAASAAPRLGATGRAWVQSSMTWDHVAARIIAELARRR
jgi:alpha-maltose-1-phosphate synthase